MTSQGRIPALVNVVIFIECRIVTEKNEFIAMAAIGKIGFSLLAQVLLETGKPSFGALPGVKVSVKLVGAEGFVAITQQQERVTKAGLQSSAGKCSQATVIAVGNKAAGKIAGHIQFFIQPAIHQRGGAVLLIHPKISHGAAKA